MKNILKEFFRYFIAFISMILIFFGLICLSYLLPKDRIKENGKAAIEDFNKEGDFYTPLFGDNNNISKAFLLDNYTDTLIMNVSVMNANSNEKSILKKAVLNQKYRDGDHPVKTYEEVFTKSKKPNGEYTRYWFGTIVIVKLLLTFITYSSIRYINMIFMLTLLFIVVLLIQKKLNVLYSIAYALAFIISGIIIIPLSLQFSPVFIISLLSTLLILLLYDKNNFEKLLPYMFMFIGGLTAFFDLLTAPLVTYGIPMIVLILLRSKMNKYTLKQDIFQYIKLSIMWIASYSLTYLAKWVIASIILNENIIKISWGQFRFRIDVDGKYKKIDIIKKNFKLYFNKIVLYALIIFIITNFIIIVKKKLYRNVNIKKIVFLFVLGCAPYFWYAVLTNHSAIHSWMTYRIQAITLLSILSIIFSFYDKKQETLDKPKNQREQ